MAEELPGGMGGPAAAPRGGGKAVASLVLGILGLVLWFIPLFGLPVTIIGLVLGIAALKSPRRGMAIAGTVMSVIGLVLSLVNAAFGVYLAMSGQHPLVQ